MKPNDEFSPRGSAWTRALGIVAVLFLLGLWAIHLDTPWSRVRGFADWIGAQNARIASNMDALGLAETGGAQLLNLEPPAASRDWILYHGHPATLDILTSRLFRWTGEREVWVQRLLPLLAALLALVLLARLAIRIGVPPWLSLVFFAAYPLTSAHGINFSYEPLCLAAMLGLVLLFERGWRWSLAPLFVVGGLLDFPVLYLAPYFALCVLFAREERIGGVRFSARRFGFGVVLGCACLASLAIHFTHVVLSGERAVNRGQGILEKILNSFAPKEGFEPDFARYASAAWEWFSTGFGVPGLLLGIVALFLLNARAASPRARRVAAAFVFAGALHCLAFRAHFAVHDFWPVYFTPAFALASAWWVGRMRPSLRVAVSCTVLVWGSIVGVGLWAERSGQPVRETVADLRMRFDDQKTPDVRPTLYQLRMPAGWALEQERGAPVYEGLDLAERLLAVQRCDVADRSALRAALEGYRGFVDNVAARGDLGRPQILVLDEGRAEAGDLSAIRGLLAAGEGELGRGGTRRFRSWALDALFEPWRFPALAALPREELEELALRATICGAARSFADDERLVVMAAAERPESRICGLRIAAADPKILAERRRAPQDFGDRSIVCTPSGPFAAAMREAAGAELRVRELPRDARIRRVLIWPPPRS